MSTPKLSVGSGGGTRIPQTQVKAASADEGAELLEAPPVVTPVEKPSFQKPAPRKVEEEIPDGLVKVVPMQTVTQKRVGPHWLTLQAGKPCLVPEEVIPVLIEDGILAPRY